MLKTKIGSFGDRLTATDGAAVRSESQSDVVNTRMVDDGFNIEFYRERDGTFPSNETAGKDSFYSEFVPDESTE